MPFAKPPAGEREREREIEDEREAAGSPNGGGPALHRRGSSRGMDTPGKFDFSFAWNSPQFADRCILVEVLDPHDSTQAKSPNSASASGGAIEHIHLPPRSGSVNYDSESESRGEAKSRLKKDAGGSKDSSSGAWPRWGSKLTRKLNNSDGNQLVEIPAGELNSMNPAGSDSGRKFMELHVISAILASKSEYFYREFSSQPTQQEDSSTSLSGRPSKNKYACSLQITGEEEAPFLELLRLLYCGAPGLADGWAMDIQKLTKLLEVSHKFGVRSCLSLCVDQSMHTVNSVPKSRLVLGLPMNVQQSSAVKPLVEQVCEFLRQHFRDIEQCKDAEDLLDLPALCLETVLESDGLRGSTEATVFDVVVKWVRRHFADDATARYRAFARMCSHVRFPFIDGDILLDNILKVPEVKASPAVEEFVLEGVRYRAYSEPRRDELTAEPAVHKRYIKRPGMGPVLTPFTWDIPVDFCETLVPNAQRLESPSFFLNGTPDLWLRVALIRWKPAGGPETCRLVVECDKEKTRRVPSEKLVVLILVRSWPAGEYTLLKRIGPGAASGLDLLDIFGMQWSQVMKNDNQFVNHGVLSLKLRFLLSNV